MKTREGKRDGRAQIVHRTYNYELKYIYIYTTMDLIEIEKENEYVN